MAKGLTYTVIFKAMSMNYGESLGNISELKKLNAGGNTYTYISRQALRYELYKSMKENFDMDKDEDSPLRGDQQVVQFKPETTATKYIEADLFGYMKTGKGKDSITRPAVVRISPAVALEPYMNDIEFGTNKNFADRAGEDPNPFQFEHQLALYSYTVTIDLDRVGDDENYEDEEINNTDKYKRIAMVLDATQLLNREIKGRIENLNPLFAIGGVYPVKNPFFLGRMQTEYDQDNKSYRIQTNLLESVLDLEYDLDDDTHRVSDNTKIGYISDFWAKEEELNQLNDKKDTSVTAFFNKLKGAVKEYYGVN